MLMPFSCKRTINIFLALVLLCTSYSSIDAKRCCDDDNILPLYDLVSTPDKYKRKTVDLEGKFYSFSTLALDYDPVKRSSKDYMGIVLARPDISNIPLVEVKLALALKKFRGHDVLSSVEQGDLIRLRGKVASIALGEPWIDVREIVLVKKVEKDEDDK